MAEPVDIGTGASDVVGHWRRSAGLVVREVAPILVTEQQIVALVRISRRAQRTEPNINSAYRRRTSI